MMSWSVVVVRSIVPLVAVIAIAACGGGGEDPFDTGGLHRVDDDAGTRDAMPPRQDSGMVDPPDAGDVEEDAGPSDRGPRFPLGTATAMSSNICMDRGVPVSSCVELTTHCNGVADAPVTLKVTEPPSAPIKGTIVFGTGGDGGGFYQTFTFATDRIINPLLAMGYRVVQRSWFPGWSIGPGGAGLLGCRSATMYQYIHDQIHRPQDGAFCATGNSGGSAEIAYTLVNYGLEEIFDAVVPTSGPPLARIDLGCLGANDEEWLEQCRMLSVGAVPACTYTEFGFGIVDGMYGGMDCRNANEAMRLAFLHDSVLNPFADLDYPNTDVRFVFGGRDFSEAVPMGRLYANAVTALRKEIEIVPNVSHIAPSDQPGAERIFHHLVDSCVER